jgi:excisionase family DNA binding protein
MMNSSVDFALRELVRDIVRDELRIAVRELSQQPQVPSLPAAEARYLSAHQAAEIAGVTAATIRDWVRKGELRGSRAGRLLRIKNSDLESYLERALEPTKGAQDLDIDARVAEMLEEERTRCASCDHLQKLHQGMQCSARGCDCRRWTLRGS